MFAMAIIGLYCSLHILDWIKSRYGIIYLGEILTKNHGLTIGPFSSFWLIGRASFRVRLCILVGALSLKMILAYFGLD